MQQPIKVYAKDYCVFCWRAKRLLAKRGLAYELIDATNKPDLRAWLAEKTGRSTVPQIWIGETHVGGFDDLKALDERGELVRLAGA
jgi:glutaredoxin 3